MIALATRSAIEGGLDSSSAYGLSDILLQRLEKCKSIPEIIRLMGESQVCYAEKVRDIKAGKSRASVVEKVKVYIRTHLNKPMSLEELAQFVNMNPSYLSRKFAAEEGIGIQKYIQRCRIEAAAEMLIMTDKSLPAIANYLCFPSQGYFGSVFKDQYGISPARYRDQNKKTDIFKSKNNRK